MNEQKECCPKFNPGLWDEKTITWEGRTFVKGKVCCFMHMPLNMGKVIGKMSEKAQIAGACPEGNDFMILSHDPSPWKSEQYMAVTKEVGGMENVKLSGTFMTKVFEGPFKDAGKWHAEMNEYVKAQGKEVKKVYFWYTTCPKCIKKYGKNYSVAFAQV